MVFLSPVAIEKKSLLRSFIHGRGSWQIFKWWVVCVKRSYGSKEFVGSCLMDLIEKVSLFCWKRLFLQQGEGATGTPRSYSLELPESHQGSKKPCHRWWRPPFHLFFQSVQSKIFPSFLYVCSLWGPIKAALYNHRGLLLVIKREGIVWGPRRGALGQKWMLYYYFLDGVLYYCV